jgi:hypothetical protein
MDEMNAFEAALKEGHISELAQVLVTANDCATLEELIEKLKQRLNDIK